MDGVYPRIINATMATLSLFQFIFLYAMRRCYKRAGWESFYVSFIEVLGYAMTAALGDSAFVTIHEGESYERSFGFIRYAAWLLSCPVLLVALMNLPPNKYKDPTKAMVAIMTNQAIVVFGVAGIIFSQFQAFLFIFGMVGGVFLAKTLLDIFMICWKTYPKESRCALLNVILATSVGWSLFPLFYALGPEFNSVIGSPAAAAALYALGDLLSKNVFGLSLWYLRWKVLAKIRERKRAKAAMMRKAKRAVAAKEDRKRRSALKREQRVEEDEDERDREAAALSFAGTASNAPADADSVQFVSPMSGGFFGRAVFVVCSSDGNGSETALSRARQRLLDDLTPSGTQTGSFRQVSGQISGVAEGIFRVGEARLMRRLTDEVASQAMTKLSQLVTHIGRRRLSVLVVQPARTVASGGSRSPRRSAIAPGRGGSENGIANMVDCFRRAAESLWINLDFNTFPSIRHAARAMRDATSAQTTPFDIILVPEGGSDRDTQFSSRRGSLPGSDDESEPLQRAGSRRGGSPGGSDISFLSGANSTIVSYVTSRPTMVVASQSPMASRVLQLPAELGEVATILRDAAHQTGLPGSDVVLSDAQDDIRHRVAQAAMDVTRGFIIANNDDVVGAHHVVAHAPIDPAAARRTLAAAVQNAVAMSQGNVSQGMPMDAPILSSSALIQQLVASRSPSNASSSFGPAPAAAASGLDFGDAPFPRLLAGPAVGAQQMSVTPGGIAISVGGTALPRDGALGMGPGTNMMSPSTRTPGHRQGAIAKARIDKPVRSALRGSRMRSASRRRSSQRPSRSRRSARGDDIEAAFQPTDAEDAGDDDSGSDDLVDDSKDWDMITDGGATDTLHDSDLDESD